MRIPSALGRAWKSVSVLGLVVLSSHNPAPAAELTPGNQLPSAQSRIIPTPVDSCDLKPGRTGKVVRILDGDTVELDDGLMVRLIGIAAPKPVVDDSQEPLRDIAHRSEKLLESLTLNRVVRLYYGGERRDRYRRALAHLFVQGGDGPAWIQRRMIAAGLARSYSFADNRSCMSQLYDAERTARRDKLGIWALPEFAVRDAGATASLLDLVDTFQIVEGKIRSAHAVNHRVYLNFGQIWKEDFTGSISQRDYARFRKAGFDLVALQGSTVRIRGWIEERGGPMIVLTHPEQLEYAGDEN